jgi:hypothetical protein
MLAALLLPLLTQHAGAQNATNETPAPSTTEASDIIATAVAAILTMEEGEQRGEWPYEGVYRVRGQIPIGYRIGGTGITLCALATAPGYADNPERQHAVARGVKFIIAGIDHPLMTPDYDGGYDVRGWGYTYGALALLRLEHLDLLPADLADEARRAARVYIDAIQRTEIPQVGGWNYARQTGRDAVSPPSPFMTSSTLQTLFLADHLGYAVNDAVVIRGLRALRAAKTASGEFIYSGDAAHGRTGGVPGAVGRMTMSEATLFLAGQATQADVRGAIDAFIVHWDWLEQRRAKHGTHERPYGVAPYYFYYAHLAAAQAIECLPTRERGEYRRRLRELVMKTRDVAGTWNDRVFPRSANYGTAMSILTLRCADTTGIPAWSPEPHADKIPDPAPASAP